MKEITPAAIPAKDEHLNNKYLIFSIGQVDYGIAINYVTKIFAIQPITEVPEFPPHIKGIVNLQNEIIPVMDVRLRFEQEFKEYSDRTCTIVVNVNGISIGLIVDKVSEILSIPDENIVSPPNISTDYSQRYIKNIGKVGSSLKLIVNCEALLNDSEVDQIIRTI